MAAKLTTMLPLGDENNPYPSIPAALGYRILKENPDPGDGYISGAFKGRGEQIKLVIMAIDTIGFIPRDFIETETISFYNSLGIDNMYFKTETVENIARNILALYGAKIHAYSRNTTKLELCLDREAEDRAFYIDTTTLGVSVLSGALYEQRIDKKYLNPSTPARAFRLESFRSKNGKLRCYFLYKCDFVNSTPEKNETSLSVISDKSFLEKATPNTKAIYQEIVKSVMEVAGPVIRMVPLKGFKEVHLVIGFKQGTAMGFFSALSDLYHYHKCTSVRKYVEQFSNGVTVISIYLRSTYRPGNNNPSIKASIHQIMKEASLLYCIPQNHFQAHFISGRLGLQETIYAHCVCHFTGNFLNRLGTEYSTLSQSLDPNNNAHVETLSSLKQMFRQETFTAEYILGCINEYPDLIRSLYSSFSNKYDVQGLGIGAMSDEELMAKIPKFVRNENQEKVMGYFITFNQHVLKTNFYTPTKVALSFRMCPKFLSSIEYPQHLYGMFMIIGSEFRGFHLRFRNIARGGIRIVTSPNREAYNVNALSMFDENYNLAHKQHRKNKDIPEGGAKGVILLDAEHQDKGDGAFEKYIDAILDLLLESKSPIVDLYEKPEILFMGPDESTAHLIDWATMRAKSRGASFWKTFFTGKSSSIGGMPHGSYGMASLSVREFVFGIYRKMNIESSEILKLQTGGPDGDLGSNEILLSNEKYGAIVDASGVLVDPKGLSYNELIRLATNRLLISQFDTKLLSGEGYRVLLGDVNVVLPDGEIIPNGCIFRNTFHLRTNLQFDIFVPCRGRPESISLANVGKLIKNGKCVIPYIVEGANLFISQDAKLRLEDAGAILFKDASANKGSVMSSSMEVLASLAFSDEGFTKHMCSLNGKTSRFYGKYVAAVQGKIQQNARLEFEALWREHNKTGKKFTILSDEFSLAIVKLDEELQGTNLWENLQLRLIVLIDAFPQCLVKTIGLDIILERVPDDYLRSIFVSSLASRFIYEYGCNSSQFDFSDFITKKLEASTII